MVCVMSCKLRMSKKALVLNEDQINVMFDLLNLVDPLRIVNINFYLLVELMPFAAVHELFMNSDLGFGVFQYHYIMIIFNIICYDNSCTFVVIVLYKQDSPVKKWIFSPKLAYFFWQFTCLLKVFTATVIFFINQLRIGIMLKILGNPCCVVFQR